LHRILDRDLKPAGIAKRDDRGRTLDVHALRTTFGTLLSKGGVAPRTAQAAMRHSDIRLTMGVYTDPKLLDVRGAMDSLPNLPLAGEGADREAARATGTDGEGARTLAPMLAPTSDNRVQILSYADKMNTADDARPISEQSPQRQTGTKEKAGCQPVTTGHHSRGDWIRTSDLLNPIQAR
jgi:hypothetical protein